MRAKPMSEKRLSDADIKEIDADVKDAYAHGWMSKPMLQRARQLLTETNYLRIDLYDARAQLAEAVHRADAAEAREKVLRQTLATERLEHLLTILEDADDVVREEIRKLPSCQKLVKVLWEARI